MVMPTHAPSPNDDADTQPVTKKADKRPQTQRPTHSRAVTGYKVGHPLRLTPSSANNQATLKNHVCCMQERVSAKATTMRKPMNEEDARRDTNQTLYLLGYIRKLDL